MSCGFAAPKAWFCGTSIQASVAGDVESNCSDSSELTSSHRFWWRVLPPWVEGLWGAPSGQVMPRWLPVLPSQMEVLSQAVAVAVCRMYTGCASAQSAGRGPGFWRHGTRRGVMCHVLRACARHK